MANKIKKRIAELTELPEELTLGLSKMTLLSDRELFVENYKGIKEYENNKIRIRTDNGDVVIEGDNLNIEEIGNMELLIKGKIRKIELEGE